MTQPLLFDADHEVKPDLPGWPCAWSPCRAYRYTLWRVWANHAQPRYANFLLLNPSTADESGDDPTIRRCIGYAKSWAYDALCVTNLFAFRATDPEDMKAAEDPVGDQNDMWIVNVAAGAASVIGGWGEHGTHLRRADAIRALLPKIHCLKVNDGGQCAHPLYLKADLEPMIWHERKAS